MNKKDKQSKEEDKEFFILITSGLFFTSLFVASIWACFYFWDAYAKGTWMATPTVLTEILVSGFILFAFIAVNAFYGKTDE
jgi:hypothetical protein